MGVEHCYGVPVLKDHDLPTALTIRDLVVRYRIVSA